MKEELYKKVYIRSEEDLPKEKGFYFVHYKHPNNRIHTQMAVIYYDDSIAGLWFGKDWYDWYLQPIEQQPLQEDEKRQLYHLNCDKCSNTYWSQEGFPKPQLCYDCSNTQQVYQVPTEIPKKVISKMQVEFEPLPIDSFKQGMFSGYAFGLQDGYKYALSQINAVDLREELIKFGIYLNTKGGRKSIQPEEIKEYLSQRNKE